MGRSPTDSKQAEDLIKDHGLLICLILLAIVAVLVIFYI